MSYNLAALLGGSVDPTYNFAALSGGNEIPPYNIAAVEGAGDHMPYWPPTEHGRRRAVAAYKDLASSNYRGPRGVWDAILQVAKDEERQRVGKYRGKFPFTVERMKQEWRHILGDADYRAAKHHRHLANVPRPIRHRIRHEIDRFLRANPPYPPGVHPPGGPPPAAPPPGPPPAAPPAAPPGPPPPGGAPPGAPSPRPPPTPALDDIPPDRLIALAQGIAVHKHLGRTRADLKAAIAANEAGNDRLIRALQRAVDMFWDAIPASPPDDGPRPAAEAATAPPAAGAAHPPRRRLARETAELQAVLNRILGEHYERSRKRNVH